MADQGHTVVPAKRPRLDENPTPTLISTMSSDESNIHKNTNAFKAVFSEGLAKEVDVGITEFISQHEGFHGIIKQRFSDFLVNEINLQGEKVTLTDISPVSGDLLNFDKEVASYSGSTDSILSDDFLSQLKVLSEGKEDNQEVTLEIKVDYGKSYKRQLHKAITEKFPSLSSSNSTRQGRTYIAVVRRETKGDVHIKTKSQGNKQTESETTVRAIVSDTFSDLFDDSQLEDLVMLAEGTSSKKEVMVEAGTDKGRRRQIHLDIARRFPSLRTTTEERDGTKYIIISPKSGGGDPRQNNSGWKDKQGGQNIPKGVYCHFVLYKENKGTMDAVNVLTRYLGINPNMLNYAGTKDKRAKTCQAMSLHRGRASRLHALNKTLHGMALGNFKYSKQSIALGDLKGNHFVVVLREVTGSDAQIEQGMASLRDIGYINYNGMQRFGTSAVPTHLVGRALIKSQWKEAVELILKPRPGESDGSAAARESWWSSRNPAVALQLLKMQCPERHLLKGLATKHENDLIGAIGFIPRNTRLLYVHAYQSYLWNLLVSRRVRECGLKPMIGDLVMPDDCVLTEESSESDTPTEKSFVEPIIVTEDNISRYTIQEVVMPLPGYDVTLPQNKIGGWYRELLAQDGLSTDDLKHKQKDYSLRGTYRRVVIKPKDLSHEVIMYEDPLVSLVLSDYEKLEGRTLPHSSGSKRALKLEFTLPSSCYATMAIREILKHDTSAAEQSLLNDGGRPQT